MDEADEVEVRMTPTQNIIHTVYDAIVCLGLSGIIPGESVSVTVNTILGFIPEQQISILFAQDDSVVNSATILFIDIQKFSAYAAALTPQEIMGNLSMIFAGFDALLPKDPLITKIDS
jgi:hypothetical protein